MQKSWLVLSLLIFVSLANGQTLGTKYTWQDTIAITTTQTDTIFPERWEQASFWFTGDDVYVKVAGVSDTTGTASKKWMLWQENQIWGSGSSDRLKRVIMKAANGTAVFRIVGIKSTPQF